MWRIKRRRTKPKTEGNKVIYPKLNSTARPNRYQSRNTYLDVKCNKELGAGCTDVGCQNTIDACGNFYSCKTAPYRNPILGYRKHLICCYNKSLWPTSFDLYISNTLYASGNIGRWTIVPELWVRPSIASLPNTPYNPVYKGPNDSSGNPIYMTFGYFGSGVGPYPASPRQWNIFNSINGKTGLEWLIIFDTAQAYNPSSSYRFTNIGNALSSNFTTVESLNLPSYPSTQDKENNLIKNIFTVTNNNSGGTNTISNLSFLSFEGKTSKDVSGNVYKDNYAKTCATHPEACYNQVIKTKQNKNGCVDESYNYTTNQYLNRRCLKFQQQEFNFLSQVPVDNSGCGTKFAVCPNCQLSTETAATSIIVAATNDNVNTLIYTRDGNTWIGLGNDIFSAPQSFSSPPSIFVKNNGKIWVAGGKDNTGAGGTSFGLAYSIDGINWTGTQTPPATDVSNISVQNAAYSNNLWMAIADYGSNFALDPSGRYKILSSSNGIDWVIKFNIPNNTNFEPYSIEYGNGTWIIFGEKTTGIPDYNNVYVSVDEGNSWSFKSTPLIRCGKGFYGNNLWVAVGQTSPVGGSSLITSNDNGNTWSQITSFYGNFNGRGNDIFYNGKLWVAVGQQGSGNVSMVYSNDGIVWNAITNPIHNMFSVAWKPNGLWVASSDTTVVSPYYYSDDGITWTASSTSIVSSPPGNFLGGGISTPFIPANKCICNKN